MSTEWLHTALASVIDPTTKRSLNELRAVDSASLHESRASIQLTFGYPVRDKSKLSEAVWAAISHFDAVDALDLDIGWRCTENSAPGIEGVRHIIAVGSGKGGVGKSTTTVNLALALAHLGASVGILDADIYGPSQPHLLGVADRRPQTVDNNQFLPVNALGLQTMSMGYLVTEKTPMVWRGPMASGALSQILKQTQWRDVDYLIIDMPPGTGDIQLTLSQQVSLSGSVIVTTPQDIALIDAKKAIEMFDKVSVPTLGIIENMSTHICSACGHSDPIFGEGGGETMATEYNVPFLGRLPLQSSIRLKADEGCPTVAAEPESDAAEAYITIAAQLSAQLWLNHLASQSSPLITITDD